jgi:glycosyltransferase involved in cell wall biosynthesis
MEAWRLTRAHIHRSENYNIVAPKIVFLLRSLDICGPVRQAIELAVGLKRHGWEVTVVTFYGGGRFADELVSRGVCWRTANKRGRWDVLPFVRRLSRLLRDERPDIVHGYTLVPNILAALVRPTLPGVRIVWGIRSATLLSPNRFDWLTLSLFPVACALSRSADLLISNSRAGRLFHIKLGYPSTRIVVIPNGTDTDVFRPDQVARREVRAQWRVGDDEILVGMVARLDRRKDHATFLRAAAELAVEDRKLKFVCVGDGPDLYRTTLSKLGSTLGLDRCLIWAGERIDMPRVYNALDLAVLSSCTEGCPNVITEAMATGVPCVVTDVGDSAKIIGDQRLVCPSRDPRLLAQTLRDAAVGVREASFSAQVIRARIENHFGAGNLAAATAQQLEALLPER